MTASVAELQIPKRKPVLDLPQQTVAGRWFHDSAFATRLADGLSLLFPEGERFFVESVLHFQPMLTDPQLVEQVKAFVAQEAAHGRAHRDFNTSLHEAGMLEVAKLERHLRRLLNLVRRVLRPKGQLAVTCALEHFTAMLAERLMRDAEDRESMDPAIRPLWMWHALEETEHKSVAFDVYQAVGGGYWRRVSLMAATSVVFITVAAYFQLRLLVVDPAPFSIRDYLTGFDHLWGRKGVFRRLIPLYLEYYRPSFHPSDRDASELIAWCRNYLYGPGGALEGKA